jgi:hypothetical protein
MRITQQQQTRDTKMKTIKHMDKKDEVRSDLVIGGTDSELIDKVIEDLKQSFQLGDYTTLEELLSYLPDHILNGHLGE